MGRLPGELYFQPGRPGAVVRNECSVQRRDVPIELHAPRGPHWIDGRWIFECSCGWESEGQDTREAAAGIECGVLLEIVRGLARRRTRQARG